MKSHAFKILIRNFTLQKKEKKVIDNEDRKEEKKEEVENWQTYNDC